jgi:hypothetical protein
MVTDLLGEYTGGYTRARVTKALIEKDVSEYGRNKLKITDPLLLEANRITQRAFFTDVPLQPFHLNDIFDMELDIWESSPGLPWIHHGFKKKRDVISNPACRQSIRKFWHFVKTQDRPMSLPDCQANVKSGISTDTPKVRAIWGYPTTATLFEMCFVKPLTEYYNRYGGPIAYGYDMATGGARKLHRRLAGFRNKYCLDIKRFDKDVPSSLIYMAFESFKLNIDFTAYKGYGIPDARQLIRAFDFMVDYFVNTSIRICDGKRFKKNGGIPSGSGWTQLIGSYINYLIITYAWLDNKGKQLKDLLVFGDDSVFQSSEFIALDDIAASLAKLGFTLNVQKSLVTTNRDEVEFLGFKISSGFPNRERDKWVAQLYLPSRPDESLDDVLTRAAGLFYASGGVDYGFAQICRRLTALAPFDLVMPREFKRFLRMLGVSTLDTVLPDDFTMLLRLL